MDPIKTEIDDIEIKDSLSLNELLNELNELPSNISTKTGSSFDYKLIFILMII